MKTSIIAVIAIVIILIAAGGFALYHNSTGNVTSNTNTAAGSSGNTASSTVASSSGSSGSGNDVVISLTAQRFQYSPGTITVHKGDHVTINVDSVDTVHGIYIPDYGVSGVDSVQFVADKAGTFTFRCPTPCGSGHRDMVGTLIVQ